MPKVTVYTRMMCGYCTRALSLLSAKGVEVEEIDITMNKKGRDEMLRRSKGGHTVPQIFIGETHVGGCSDLMMLDHEGGLDPLLEGPGWDVIQ
jgi:glutaredoxin 3